MKEAEKYIDRINCELEELKNLLEDFPGSELEKVVSMGEIISGAIIKGNVVFTCGNGGSAADAQHIAGELVGRFRRKIKGYKAFAMTTNSSVITALANDFSYSEVFSRQLESVGHRGDVLLALSTSGSSPNVVEAVETAASMGVTSLALSGKDGGKLAERADLAVVVPHHDFARIQEIHMTLGHILCGLVEEMVMAGREKV